MTLSAIRQAYFALMTQSLDPAFLARVEEANPFFTSDQVLFALRSVRDWFQKSAWVDFDQKYPKPNHPRRVGIIMAGNVPFVGLHDLLAVLMTGHVAIVKPSHKDRVLVQAFVEAIPIAERDAVQVVDELPASGIDFLIATGSGATALHLRHTYKGLPQLIRGNRYSVAILTGREEPAELELLALDLLAYHGLGCRSVSNIIVPPDFDPTTLQEAIEKAELPAMHAGWGQLVNWEKAIGVMKDAQNASTSRLHIEYAEELGPARPGVAYLVPLERQQIANKLRAEKDRIQCIVGKGHIPLGDSQNPGLMDFADNVDTFALLSELGSRPF